MLIKRSKKSTSKQQSDKGSLILLWITITFCFTLGFVFANYTIWSITNNIIALGGLLIIVSGIAIRWISIFQLKKAFTVDVAIGEDQTLTTNGMYKLIRHPSYLGLLLIMIGFSICMNSIVSIIVITIPMFLVVIYRISVEEKVLINEFKENYISYKLKTKKIIPWIF